MGRTGVLPSCFHPQSNRNGNPSTVLGLIHRRGFVLRSGIPWEMLPQELGCGSGMTYWRRLRDWQEAGIWQLIHFTLLDWLARRDRIDWSRALVDGAQFDPFLGAEDGSKSYRSGQARQQAPSDMRRSRVKAFWRFNSQERTATTHSKLLHSSMLSRHCKESVGGLAIVPTAC
jgi:transposase